ncbi:glutamyl-tRNAGlu reductase, N-terminal domain protein, partial [Chlamydia psittaci 06-1683]
HRD